MHCSLYKAQIEVFFKPTTSTTLLAPKNIMSDIRRPSFLALSGPIEHSPVFSGDDEVMNTASIDAGMAIPTTATADKRRKSSFSQAPLSLSPPSTTLSNQLRPRADSQD